MMVLRWEAAPLHGAYPEIFAVARRDLRRDHRAELTVRCEQPAQRAHAMHALRGVLAVDAQEVGC
ncbi:hypothetical protein I6F35_38340 [Bradyrhizobium sp. BRP22]|uniref:hypothetical protein n=1 Tax=Bradyrhizobium sp. BRP22 TaxID=2793821 RepID=UPI001CD546DA|nr:hypothetical protein [Bradyrhizobium sp. BRP22]MCA1458919.1 hypothetical protein [Bradyrhizobium sp. BRP22]